MEVSRYTISLFSASPNPALNKQIEQVCTPTWDELPAILTTRNWSPAVYEGGSRNLANYRGHPHLFAFDIDADMTLEQAREAFQDYQCMILPSRNHQKVKNVGTPSEKPACDRFRVVFALSEPILTEDDFKATWEAYADRYPLDPQTKSASMYFFKSTSTFFNNPTGKKLAVIPAAAWNETKATTYAFVKGEEGATRGKLSQMSEEFLLKGAPAGFFNLRLFKCAVDHLEQRYYQEEFLDRCARAAKAGAFAPLDATDLATVASAYQREPKYGLRAAGSSHVEAQKQDIANRIMEGEFVQCIQPLATLWYQIKDFENKEVEMIQNEQILDRHIDRELQKPENHYATTSKGPDGKMVNTTKKMTVKEVKERWALAGEAIHALPKPVLWRGVPGYCHKRFASDFTPGQPHPAWDEFTQRLSEPEIFKAWVFACFVPENETRQALWLHGPGGEDGKTKVIEALATPFGSAAASITGGQLQADKRFFLTQFLGKCLAVYPDCMNRGFTKTESFRNLTGGDLVTMEIKGGGFIHDRLRLKVLIGSNFEPEMTDNNYDRSRMILIDVAPSQKRDDPQWPERLKAQLPAFLGDCQLSYRRLCPNGGKIAIPDGMVERLGDVSDTSQERFQYIFDENFTTQEAGPRGPGDRNTDPWVSAHELYNLLAEYSRANEPMNQLVGDFRKFLELRSGVQKRRKTDQKWYYFGLVFKDEKARAKFNKAGI